MGRVAQTRPLPGRASLLAGTGSSVVVATTRPGTQCTGVTLWAGARLVSAPPLAGCEDGLSGGAGVGAVATSGADTLVRTGTTVASLSPTTLAWAAGSHVSRTPAPR